MSEIDERYDAAAEKYLAQNPTAVSKPNAFELSVIAAMGNTIEDDRIERRNAAFEKAAAAEGIDGFELAIRMLAESPEQAQKWRFEQRRDIANALGLKPDQYTS
jgi:hypothetical protein